MKKDKSNQQLFEKFAAHATNVTGSPWSFMFAVVLVAGWAVCGPVFNFSETWQLVINTGTTIITFLMVFIIQQTQNKDTMAMHLKLNELIASMKGASNRLIDIEDLTEAELKTLKKYYIKLSELAKQDKNILATHSIEEAQENHNEKLNT